VARKPAGNVNSMSINIFSRIPNDGGIKVPDGLIYFDKTLNSYVVSYGNQAWDHV